MKKLTLTILTAAFMAACLNAQETRIIKANIPFEFVVANTTLPAGIYLVKLLPEAGIQLVRASDRDTYSFVANPDGPVRAGQHGLVFHRYGNQHFLARISTSSLTRDLPRSRVERRLEKQSTSPEEVHINFADRAAPESSTGR